MDVLTTLPPITEPLALADAYDLLGERSAQLADDAALSYEPRIMRAVVPVERADPWAWLAAQPHAAKVYWSERHDDCETAAVGVADLLTSRAASDVHSVVGALQTRLAAAPPDVRYYGGLRFDAYHRSAPSWDRFGTYRFVLPQWELRRQGAVTTLACNIVARPSAWAPTADTLHSLALPLNTSIRPLAAPVARTDAPNYHDWQRMIEAALDLFRRGTLRKIVLARKATFRCAAAPDPIALLRRLQAVTPNSFHFCFQPEHGLAFVGATPERLYGRTGRMLRSEAIAGTRPNGATAADTARLGDELLASEKDVREHVFVREHIKANLEPLCDRLRIAPQPALLRLTRRQHLWTPIDGHLHAGVTDADLLSCLHPTPAVGGEPTAQAMQYIADLEPFDRGWYAGPVGWIARGSAEFAVAIRSALVDGAQLALYSGAGIVPGSTPQSEWDEIENKISDFVNILHDA